MYVFKHINHLFLFLIVFSVSIVSGQNKKTTTNKKPKSVQSSNQNTKPISFSFDFTKIPLNFKGQNSIELYNILKKKSVEILKDEFETTTQFEDRVKSINNKPIIGNLSEDSIFVFKPKHINLYCLNFEYDADSQDIELSLQIEDQYELNYQLNDKKKAIVLNETTVKESEYKGKNAFGVSKEIHSKETNIYSLIIDNWTDFTNSGISNDLIKFNFKVEPKIAKLIKENDLYSSIIDKKGQLGSLYIGKIIRPFTYEVSYNSGSPTLSKPYDYTRNYKYINFNLEEIWIYNINTGEIYLKIKPED